MITCPWCGTNFVAFQSNCSNCGGPLPAQDAGPGSVASEDPPEPPAAPRPISNRYVWRLLGRDAWVIVGFVFSLLGIIFALVGGGLTFNRITAFVGIPFLVLGLAFLAASAGLLGWRYPIAMKTVRVLRAGDSARGQITQLQQNGHVVINGRMPWVIEYEFHVDGQSFAGNVTTLNSPGPALQAGKAVRILYLRTDPKWNSIYPHP